MKILIIISSLFAGGAERVSLDLSRYLVKNGDEVHLLVARISKRYPAVYEVPEGVFLHHVPFGTENGVTRPMLNSILLLQTIRKVNPDWVVSLGMQYKLLKATGILGSRKVLLSERNYPPMFYTNDEKSFVSSCYSLASAVVFQTQESADCFSNLDARKKWIIPNAVKASSDKWSGWDSKHIAFMGRLVKQKNPAMLLEAFKIFHDDHRDYYLDLFGDGELKDELKDLADHLGIKKFVIFHGQRADAIKRVSKSLMYVSSSDYEGISNAMLEAMGMGMPCVCTDCEGGGARLAIQDGVNGLLVPCGDPIRFAEAMCRIADSEVFARKIGDAAKESMEWFSPEKTFRQWYEILTKFTG